MYILHASFQGRRAKSRHVYEIIKIRNVLYVILIRNTYSYVALLFIRITKRTILINYSVQYYNFIVEWLQAL
jgi:hypothetical protein